MATSAIEQNFLRELLFSEQKRLDGRALNEPRDFSLVFGSEYGHVEVRLGNTWLVAQVSAEVADPRPERPFEGLFHITTDVSAMASPKFDSENNSTEQEEILVSRMIEKSIRRSNALDLESLCIVAGSRCWMIRADVHYLNYDGGLVDASCIGVVAALLHFRRPDTSIDGERVIVHDISERPPVPLSVLHLPICASWSFLSLPTTEDDDADSDSDSETGNAMKEGQGTRIIAVRDSTAAEQDLSQGEMVITINKDRDVCQITKAGGAQLSTEALMAYCEQAHEFAKVATKKIQDALKADFETKNRGNLGTDLGHLSSALNDKPLV